MKSKWGIRKLGDLCNISSSKRIFAREYCSKGVPFYRGKEIIEKHKGNAVSTEPVSYTHLTLPTIRLV